MDERGAAGLDETLAIEIETLRTMKTKALKARYRDLFGEDSRSSNHDHLFRRIAWRLQALAEGDLTERARQRATQLAQDADLRLRAPRRFWRKDGWIGLDPVRCPARDRRLPPVGTIVKRVYRNHTIEVKILPAGFEYAGEQYPTLSLIAHRITGTRWNGFHFFGLKKEWGA